MTRPPYSVVLPVRNEIHTLADVVAAYLGQDVAPSEVLLCVNGSTDGTLELSRSLEADHPGLVRVVESAASERKPGAWRAGFAAAANDFILFGDGDALPSFHNGGLLVEAIVRDTRVAAAASAICVVRPERPRTLFDWFSPDVFGVRPGQLNLQGAQYMLHRRRWERVVAQLGIPLMPDVVSEDGYIGRAINVSSNYSIATERRAETYVQPVASLREYNLLFCRLGHAGMELEAFPPLRTSPAPPRPPHLGRVVLLGIRRGIRERDIIFVTKALGTAWYTWSWFMLVKREDRLPPAQASSVPSADDLWDLNTAKSRFSRTLVESVGGDRARAAGGIARAGDGVAVSVDERTRPIVGAEP